MRRHLIVNADDFGMAESVNAGIAEAHESGIVTSATLMVDRLAAGSAAAYALSHPNLSVGLHLDLGEWLYRDGAWVARYEVVDVSDRAAVAGEVERQLERFEALLGRPPSHLDSHQHVHRQEPVAAVVREAGRQLGVTVRHQSRDIAYRGDFYGQWGKGEPYPEGITVDALVAVIRDLSPGWSELGCHPGAEHPRFADPYGAERAVELGVLCDSRVRSALADSDVSLASFHDVNAPGAAGPVT
jgi:predicted glycoside hydrolase/deacetylase ChbG (UPF0249 family)